MRPVAVNGGMGMRAPCDVVTAGGARREDAAGVRQSPRRIEVLIERARGRGEAPRRSALVGFSQGGAMARQAGLRYPERLAGVAALSCFLPLADTVAAEACAANLDLPVFMAHEQHDELNRPSRGCHARDLSAWLHTALA